MVESTWVMEWRDLLPDVPHDLSIHFPHLEDVHNIYFMCCQEDYMRVCSLYQTLEKCCFSSSQPIHSVNRNIFLIINIFITYHSAITVF